MDPSLITNDVSALVANIGMGYTLLGFICGAIVAGAIIYVVSR